MTLREGCSWGKGVWISNGGFRHTPVGRSGRCRQKSFPAPWTQEQSPRPASFHSVLGEAAYGHSLLLQPFPGLQPQGPCSLCCHVPWPSKWTLPSVPWECGTGRALQCLQLTVCIKSRDQHPNLRSEAWPQLPSIWHLAYPFHLSISINPSHCSHSHHKQPQGHLLFPSFLRAAI